MRSANHSLATRRTFLQASAAVSTLAFGGWARNDAPPPAKLDWHNVEDWGLEGKGFDDTALYYDRLPARAEQKVRTPVWNLSRHSAGMVTRFNTDATSISVRYRLTSSRLAMPHMPATGVSGLDLYALDDTSDARFTDRPDPPWRWSAVVMPKAQSVEAQLLTNVRALPNGQSRQFQLYLPLYNGVASLEIGVPSGSTFNGIGPRSERPIVFYGTSIMHGACASRPGLSISSILGRRLDRPVINLGFSGNGTMEKSVGEFLGELNPSVYAIDCLPNMNAQQVTERCRPFVEQLHNSRPETPILLVEDRVNTGAWLRNDKTAYHQKNHAALKAAHQQLISDGFSNVHYLGGAELLGSDGEGATDGSHPNDLGMVRYANAYEPALRKLVMANP